MVDPANAGEKMIHTHTFLIHRFERVVEEMMQEDTNQEVEREVQERGLSVWKYLQKRLARV